MKNKARTLSLLVALALALTLLPCTALAAGFSDVPAGAWYAADVKAVADAGIVNGKGGGIFAPNDNITLAETVKLAAVVHAKLTGSSFDFSGGNPWYQPYEDYFYLVAQRRPMMYDSPSGVVNRTQFAELMAISLSTFSASEKNKNTVEGGGIPDLYSEDAFEDVYALYRAGILTGSDAYGTFNPGSNITRAEVAAIVRRFIDPSARKSITLTKSDANAAPTPAGSDGDQTGWNPPGWTWQTEGTEGYGLPQYTSGKYIRSDGKAVLYIDSSDSADFFQYWMYVIPEGAHQNAYVVPGELDPDNEGFANVFDDGSACDLYSLVSFQDTGYQAIEVSVDWIDELFYIYPDPSGIYLLSREKRP